MIKVKTSPSGAFASFDHMSWPRPSTRLWQTLRALRYGTPTRADLLIAAACMAAYEEMIRCPRKKREHVVRTLRKVMSGPRGKVSP